ncbi:TIGR02117 family protein [Aquimarina gracilis]|uniref:TIGR02117 family protein n=1 Tax=Aquimarina gracilis TaxID=874422 RepID=A0ABU5ZS97_9FLAO|nr:TIGR02117 family protein [Aquimarina gracilis]MEB3344908.1 TIGR02117 family protein [Aquimarina gracilis]
MKKRFKKILRYISFILLIPIAYIIVSLTLTYIPVNTDEDATRKNSSVYLSSNGVHLEIIIPKEELDPSILEGLKFQDTEQFFSFGWGDRMFYVETPTWGDLTFVNGFRALFVNTSTLLHVTRYSVAQKDWVEIKINADQLQKINTYINNAFRLDANDHKILLPGLGYYKNDDFYEATGNYNCFRTCNSWVNTGLKQSDIKACLWTPYDFRLLDLHR